MEEEVGKEPEVPDNNNTGEEVEEEPTIPIPEEEKKAPTGAYTPLQFNVKQIKKNVPDIPEQKEEEKKPDTSFSKEDSKFFAQMIWNIPPAVMGDYLTVDEKLVNTWGEQLFAYCERKGLNPYDYLFDELGLVMSTGVIAASLVAKYKKHKKEEKEKEDAEEKP
jgi:hypothetical protein